MINKISYIIFAISAYFFSSNIFGQTRCAVGTPAGSAHCIPDDEGSAPPRATGEWIKTWGAVVNSVKVNEGWSSVGKFSEEDARNDALNKCYSSGANDCSVQATYFNQCLAIVVPIGGGSGNSSTGKDEAIASKRALDDCKKRVGLQCSVLFAECTNPFFKKYSD
ncbi:DUF4189 domain-containing protein [Xanthomonas hyacinthi]|uniref:DUF4189 domain-containing protein n=1 Tax=Xanthomonas hyacinthi TaxID=56455 RepID=A0A2S7ENB7_9XANT|nr:DUF4189 domain-containing protein [Xanthomonas hyacinthi]PPU92698.1 hypothetical protein XhyaCFBP1156_20965 [Xanthomonas hyacinthi]QGY75222.1 DUF4189 domain-containing protein [Xanthomonas hyacinthi]